MNKSELHLFIIWQKGRYKELEILNDIAKNFTLLRKYAITWNPELVSSNFTRFYGVNLPPNSGKEIECGTGEFLLCVVRDENPIYDERLTSHGLEIVNVNMFDAKDRYRAWTGGGHKIHGTNSEKETNHDLTLLVGKNVEDFLSENVNSITLETLQMDIEGAQGWESLEHMFYVLNNTVSYVILRGSMESSSPPLLYVDTDFITTDYENFRLIVNGVPALSIIRPKSEIHIGENMYYLDVWDSRKNYYDPRWLQDMLETTVVRDGMRVLNEENDFYCLLYHCITNKGYFDEKYAEKLQTYKKKFNIKEDDWAKVLVDWMSAHDYDIIKHTDSSNGFNISNPAIQEYATRWGICIKVLKTTTKDVRTHTILCWESRVYEKDETFVKKGTPWLIDNEKRILSSINLPYVPKIVASGIDKEKSWIEITRMDGLKVDDFLSIRKNFTISNLKAIVRIGTDRIFELYRLGVMHRDITPENILVYKSGNKINCNIIDFGSAILYMQDTNFPCPPLLGKHYAPESMYSDFYSYGNLLLEICRKMPYLQCISNELKTIQWNNYTDSRYVEQVVGRVWQLSAKSLTLKDYYVFYRKKYSSWHKYLDQPILIPKQILKRIKRIFK